MEASHFIISSSLRSSPPPLVSLGLGLQSMRFSLRVMSHMRLGGQKCFICKTEKPPRPPSYITHTEKVTREQTIQFVADRLLIYPPWPRQHLGGYGVVSEGTVRWRSPSPHNTCPACAGCHPTSCSDKISPGCRGDTMHPMSARSIIHAGGSSEITRPGLRRGEPEA